MDLDSAVERCKAMLVGRRICGLLQVKGKNLTAKRVKGKQAMAKTVKGKKTASKTNDGRA